MPYLVRVLGVEKYGLVNFAFAFAIYFTTLTDYGFSLSATREIAVEKNNQAKLEAIFNSTFFSKILLLVPTTAIYFFVVLLVPYFNVDKMLYIIVYFSIIGSLLFPNWFFIGIERMQLIAIINIIFRVMSVIAIYLLVQNSNDILVYATIICSYQILVGIAGILYIVYSGFCKIKFPGWNLVFARIRKGFSIFTSSFAIMLYTTSNTFVLGLLSGTTAVGLFSGADKMRLAAQNIGGIAGQTVYPHTANLFAKSKLIAKTFLKKYTKIFGVLFLFLGIVLFFGSDFIIRTFLGVEFVDSIIVLKILSFLPLIIFLSNLFGIQIMLNLGFDKAFNRIIIAAALIHLTLLFLLIPHFAQIGTAISMLVTEVFVTTSMITFVLKRKLFINAI